MEEFKIGDEIEEQTADVVNKRLKTKRRKGIIIVAIVSIAVGLITFFISDAILNGRRRDSSANNILTIEDMGVKNLYSYVTYGTNGIRNDLFVKNKSVSIDTFSNQDKFYYALQFASANDFEYTGEVNQNQNKVYLISDKKIKDYMQTFFGPSVSYSSDIELSHTFSFIIDNMNVGDMVYSGDKNGFETTFTKKEENTKKESLTTDIVGKLFSVKTDASGKIIIDEKVVFTNIKKNDNNMYDVEIYKDYNKEQLLDRKVIASIDDNYVDLSKISNPSIIEYTFAPNGSTYYFESSSLVS